MAVEVSRDLTVQVLEDVNAVKLIDQQKALKAAVQRGEPKCLGVSQLILGLLVISYSLPLHMTEFTEVVDLGVPWWSGVTFIVAGSAAIYLDKRCTLKILQVCLLVSLATTVLSVVAIIIYSVDMHRNPEVPCVKSTRRYCNDHHYASRLSRGVKSTLLLFTLTQTIISIILTIQLYRQKRIFGPYATLANTSPPTTPTATSPPERN